MKAYSVMLFLIAINISVYILIVSGAWAGQYPEGYASPEAMSDIFKLQNVDLTQIIMIGIGGLLGGILALVTRQFVFASVALLIWVVCVLFTPIGWIITAFPLTVKSLALMSGAPTAIADITEVVLSAFYVFIFFMFILEIASQRYMK